MCNVGPLTCRTRAACSLWLLQAHRPSLSLSSCVCVHSVCRGLRKLGNSVSKVEFREIEKPGWRVVWFAVNLDVTLFSLELRCFPLNGLLSSTRGPDSLVDSASSLSRLLHGNVHFAAVFPNVSLTKAFPIARTRNQF